MADLGQKIATFDVVGRADMPVKERTYLLTCVEESANGADCEREVVAAPRRVTK